MPARLLGRHLTDIMYSGISVLLSLLYSSCVLASDETHGETQEESSSSHNVTSYDSAVHGLHETIDPYEIAVVDWKHVETPYAICIWLLLASFAKIGFHMFKKLPSLFPESCVLVLLGLVVGVIVFFVVDERNVTITSLTSDLFFLFLLPPIVLEAGYFLPNRSFFDNFGTIMLYAVVGTLFNTFMIAISLYAICQFGWVQMEFNILTILVFSALISAVDPVAVLAVFEEVHVNEVLHILVFGESLLNDAVTVVLYHMFEGYAHIGEENITSTDIIYGVISFFIVGTLGTAIGMTWGLLTSYVTKFTNHVRVIEPLVVFVMAYLAYLTAEIFHFSGIMSIVFCAIIMKPYVEANVSEKSRTTIKYFMKMLASICETVIFMMLGLSAVNDGHQWDNAFVLCTLFFCFFYRGLGVVILTGFANLLRTIKINRVEQFTMAYGGIRGGVAFSLVVLLDENVVGVPQKGLLVTTCIAVVFFTIFIQGMTIKPLVNKLKVKKSQKHDPTVNEKIGGRMIDHISAGMEDIIGHRGHNYWRDKWEVIQNTHLQQLLVRDPSQSRDHEIIQVYRKINIKEAVNTIEKRGSVVTMDSEPSQLSLSSYLRRNTSYGEVSMASRRSFNGIPKNEASCLDMNSLEMNNLEHGHKNREDSISHHLEENVLNKLQKPWKQHYSLRRWEMDDIDEPSTKMMHRSMSLHLRHVIKKKKEKQRRCNQTLRGNHLAPPTANSYGQKKNNNVNYGLPEGKKVLPCGGITIEVTDNDKDKAVPEPEEEGITFTATTDDSPDYAKPPPYPPSCTAVETSLPWQRPSIAIPSDRARDAKHDLFNSPTNTPPTSPAIDNLNFNSFPDKKEGEGKPTPPDVSIDIEGGSANSHRIGQTHPASSRDPHRCHKRANDDNDNKDQRNQENSNVDCATFETGV